MTSKQVSRTILIMVATFGVGVVGGMYAERTTSAQQSGITRTELTRVDVPGSATHEAVMAVAEIAPGASSGRHYHHGVEIGYVIDGSMVVERPDGSNVSLKQGQSFRNPIAEVHNAKNPGATPVKILAVYIVEKGKPLAETASDHR